MPKITEKHPHLVAFSAYLPAASINHTLHMKWPSLTIGLLLGLLLGYGLTKLLSKPSGDSALPQRLSDAPRWQWPDSLDATRAAGANHRVLYENDSIRLLEVLLRPHEYEKMHTHEYPSIMFGPRDTASFDIIYYRYGYDSGKHSYYVKDSIRQHRGGDDRSKPNIAHYLAPEAPHRIRNLSDATIDVFRVEFKTPVKK